MELARGLWQVGSMKTPRAIDSFTEIATARIELKDTDPPIWREVEVPTSITLKVLHDIVQATIGWMDYHLWEFVIDGRAYGLPEDEDWGTAPRKEAAKVRLRDVLEPGETVITYTYDFGDDWVHEIRITDIRQGEPGLGYPRYVAGERNGPPEDCGGVPGFYDVLEARADPEHRWTRDRRSPGSTTTTRTPSTSCRSSMPSAASPPDATPPELASQSQRPEPAVLTGGLRRCADRGRCSTTRGSEKVSGSPNPDHIDHLPIRFMSSSQLGGPVRTALPDQAALPISGPR